MSVTLNAAKQVIRFTSPLAGLLLDMAERASKSVDSAASEGLEKLNEEVAKETLKMQFALQQARVAQELAIAKRIENAEEVEIEEFYDTAGKGQAGLNLDQNSGVANLGLGVEGRQVVKRIYHFRGGNPVDVEAAVIEAK